MKLLVSAAVSKPGCESRKEVGNLSIQLVTASPEAKTVVSSSFCQKGRNNMLISEIISESLCFSSISPRQNFLKMSLFCY